MEHFTAEQVGELTSLIGELMASLWAVAVVDACFFFVLGVICGWVSFRKAVEWLDSRVVDGDVVIDSGTR